MADNEEKEAIFTECKWTNEAFTKGCIELAKNMEIL